MIGGAAGDDAVPLTLLTVSAAPGAVCMDGSQGGFYHRKATNATMAGRWVLYLEGGGECVTAKRCLPISESALGSSKHFSQTYDFFSGGKGTLISSNCHDNHEFCGANLVYLPYCSQDLW
eukprot:gene7711-1379_t